MASVDHKKFQIRVILEQVVDYQEYPSTPGDTGRTPNTIAFNTKTYDVAESLFGEAFQDPTAFAFNQGRDAGDT